MAVDSSENFQKMAVESSGNFQKMAAELVAEGSSGM
jgi:hypothetical protein